MLWTSNPAALHLWPPSERISGDFRRNVAQEEDSAGLQIYAAIVLNFHLDTFSPDARRDLEILSLLWTPQRKKDKAEASDISKATCALMTNYHNDNCNNY